MSCHLTLPELSLHRVTERSGTLHHPSMSAMQLEAISQHSPFSLIVLHRWSLWCRPWCGFCCWAVMLEEGVRRGRNKW